MVRNVVVRHARSVAIFVVGMTVIVLGIIMVIGPGPGAVTIYGGIAILATEFVWARRLMNRTNEFALRHAERGARRFGWMRRLVDWLKKRKARDGGDGGDAAASDAPRGECAVPPGMTGDSSGKGGPPPPSAPGAAQA